MARRHRARREALLRRGEVWVEQASRPCYRELTTSRTIMDRALVSGAVCGGHGKAADGWTEGADGDERASVKYT